MTRKLTEYRREIALALAYIAIAIAVYFYDPAKVYGYAAGGLVGLLGGLFLQKRLERRYAADKLIDAAPWVFLIVGFSGGLIGLIVVATFYILLVSKKSTKLN